VSEIQFGKRYRLKAGGETDLSEVETPLMWASESQTMIRLHTGTVVGRVAMADWFLRNYELDDQPATDPVNHPAHYKAGDIERIDAIKAALTPEEFRGYVKGNAIKYCWRERHKGGDEDLRKAGWYLVRVVGDK
jgi:hypothetical protein